MLFPKNKQQRTLILFKKIQDQIKKIKKHMVVDEQIGLGTEIRSEKIPRNRLGMISDIPRKNAFIPRHSEFRGRASSEPRDGTEWNGIPRKKLVLRNRSKIT